MPLHGKIVVIKRSGGDGTEFPLTASCLFGRKPDCDIRIQLPQVSKEHCRIDLNENKEVVLTNLSSVNPTRVNGEVLQQSERLKHGDVITVIDRSFRFEYPPAPTPKKRSSSASKSETLKVLQNQQVVDTVSAETGEKRISEVLTDGIDHDQIQRSLEKTEEVESKQDSSMLQQKTSSPFNDLYQMIKQSLDVKTPRKSSASLLQTPTSRFRTPKTASVRKNDGKHVDFTHDKSSPMKSEAGVFHGADESKSDVESIGNKTPKSVKKHRRSAQLSTQSPGPAAEEAQRVTKPKRNSATSQNFTECEVIEEVAAQTPKSPMRRRSKEAKPAKPAVTKEQDQAPTAPSPRRVSPRNLGKTEKDMSKKRKSGELAADLPMSQMKRKRVSFGGHLSPELFDKRLPPDSPLQKGAVPRRSLCLYKPKPSLLRRASVIGLLKECEQDKKKVKSPAKKKTPSPKKSSNPKSASPKTPTPEKRSPKAKSPSPRTTSPRKKSPSLRSCSPKRAGKSPASKNPSPKRGTSPLDKMKTPNSRRYSTTPAEVPCKETPSGMNTVAATPVKTPLNSRVCTPVMQGRFSVSRISTPSPAEEAAVPVQIPQGTVTPKIPLRRKSMKSTSRKTPNVSKSAVKVIRRSGISRASMKVKNTYADIVRFGQPKARAAAPVTKMNVIKKTTKKAVPKLQTPARKLKGHVSTGHADSPVTIVVGKAHKQKVVEPTGAAPKVIVNTALFKKNMKMDEDLTGISDMFKTPVNEKKRKSVIRDNNTTETPVGVMSTSVVDPSVLNTPEEPGEMVVSPLSVASVVKGRRYNSEAVQRLLNADQESHCINDIAAVDAQQQSTDVKAALLQTPKHKPEEPQCLTGVKRIMKTPKQKPEPVEDLRGKILKTPKQKSEQKECLTGVKRIMKTPKQMAEPVEDIRGKLLLTPKQKPEEKECLTGVKRIMKTPREKSQPIEDIRGNLLVTPKQKPEEKECLTGVKRIFQTPQQEAEHLEDPQGQLLKDAADVSVDVVEEHQETSVVCLTGVKSAAVEDMVGVKRPMKAPREKTQPIEDNFGIKRLMKSPRLRGVAPVEDFEGLKELMEEPQSDPSGQQETNEPEDQTPLDCGDVIAKELDFVLEEQQNITPSDLNNDVPYVDMATEPGEIDDNETKEDQSNRNNESSDPVEAISETTEDNTSAVEQPKEAAVIENKSEEQQTTETTSDKAIESDTAAVDPVQEETSLQSVEKQTVREQSEDAVVPARKGRKPRATAPSTVRQTTRSRNAKTTGSRDADLTEENVPQPSKASVKPRRGRNGKRDADQPELVHVVATETEVVPDAEHDRVPPADVDHTASDSAAPQEDAVSKPRRERKAKQASKPSQPVMDEQDVSCAHQDNVSPVDTGKDVNGICSDQLEVISCGKDKSLDIVATAPQTFVTESVPEVDTGSVPDLDAAPIKKPVRGRGAKMPQSKAAEETQEAADLSEDVAVAAPVRGRRGKIPAPPVVRRATRTRNAKSQESPYDDKPEHIQEESVKTPVTDISSEAVSDQTALVNTCQEEDESASPEEEAVVKTTRGRKRKQAPVKSSQPQKNEAVSAENLMADSQPPVPIVAKPRRGRKAKPDTTEQSEATEDVAVEMEQLSQPPVRAKRGRNATQDEDNKENDTRSLPAEIPNTEEPVKTLRRTRKMEPVVPAVMSTEKPRRGRRGKEVSAKEVVTAKVPEEKLALEPEPEIKTNAEPDAPIIKPTRARRLKTSVKIEVSQATPAKRACRGAASPLRDTNAESTAPEPAKRGRRVAAVKTSTVEPSVRNDQMEKPSDPSSAVAEETKSSKRSVRWKQEHQIFPIPKVTPVKAVRGRKSKLVDQVEADSKNDANKTEEKDLSDKVVEAQPIKRARQGSKVTDKAASSTTEDPKKGAEEETQVKTRRGRSAKK